MGKVKLHSIQQTEKLEIIGDFCQLVNKLKNKKDVSKLFMGLLTLSEIMMIVRRIQIAQMILLDKSNVKIKKKLQVGSDNIINISKWLYDESNDIFRKQISKNLEDKIKHKKNGSNDLDYYPEVLKACQNQQIINDFLNQQK